MTQAPVYALLTLPGLPPGTAGRRRSVPFFLLLATTILALFPRSTAAQAPGVQTATVQTEENFRLDPNGTILAQIRPGSVLSVEERRGGWVRATLDGWVWSASLQDASREDFDLRISSEGGENLRVEPQGTILARLQEGMLVEEVERRESWIRVRRSAWIWARSVSVDGDGVPVAAGQQTEDPGAVTEPGSDWTITGEEGVTVLSAPDGDTLGRSAPGAELRIVGRRGSWVRVQLEGWAWMPEASGDGGPDAAVLTDVTPGDVADEPERYRGRLVSWELQFISREEAEQIRTDFYEGEPYLLTRHAGEMSRFVYVTVPPERLAQVEELTALERIVVVGRIRTGSAQLTGGPILDLRDLSRPEGAGSSP